MPDQDTIFYFIQLSLFVCLCCIGLYLIFRERKPIIGFFFFVLAVFLIFPAIHRNVKKITANVGGAQLSAEMSESYSNNVIKLPLNEDKQANKRENQEPSPEDYLNLAAQAWLSKKYDEALDHAHAGLRLNPINNRVKAALLTQVGAVFLDLKNGALASKNFNDAIKTDPDLSTPHYALGNLYREQGEYAKAEDEYKKSIQLEPNNAYSIFNYGTLDLAQKKYKDAEIKLNEAIRLFPKFAEAYINLGILYDEKSEEDKADKNLANKAEQYLVKAIELNSGLPSSHINLGNFYAKRNRFNDAEKEYKKAIELAPDLAEAHNNLGALYSNWKKYDLAEKELREAIRLKPDYAMASQNLGLLLKMTRE